MIATRNWHNACACGRTILAGERMEIRDGEFVCCECLEKDKKETNNKKEQPWKAKR